LSLLSAGSTIELVDAVCTGKVQNGMAIVRSVTKHFTPLDVGKCVTENVPGHCKRFVFHTWLSVSGVTVTILQWSFTVCAQSLKF